MGLDPTPWTHCAFLPGATVLRKGTLSDMGGGLMGGNGRRGRYKGKERKGRQRRDTVRPNFCTVQRAFIHNFFVWLLFYASHSSPLLRCYLLFHNGGQFWITFGFAELLCYHLWSVQHSKMRSLPSTMMHIKSSTYQDDKDLLLTQLMSVCT